MTKPKTLEEREGSLIALVALSVFEGNTVELVKLHRVEQQGLWIESQTLIDGLLEKVGFSIANRTVIFFLPWHRIDTILDSIDIPSSTSAVLNRSAN